MELLGQHQRKKKQHGVSSWQGLPLSQPQRHATAVLGEAKATTPTEALMCCLELHLDLLELHLDLLWVCRV